MRIECIDGDGAAGNAVKIKEEPTTPEIQSSSESSQNTTPEEEEVKPIIPKPVPELSKTRGVKVRYNFDEAAASGDGGGDDDFLPGNTKKKRRTASRHAKVELPDIGGYRPSRKKRINRKDPNRCHVCRQR
jgi:hypothetical protein